MNDLILGHGKIRLGIVVHVRIPSIDLRNQPNFGQSNSNLLLDSFEPMLGSDKDLELFIGEIKKVAIFLQANDQFSRRPISTGVSSGIITVVCDVATCDVTD